MASLVKDLLNTSAAQLGKIEMHFGKVNVSELIQAVVELYFEAARAKQQRIEFDSEIYCVLEHADKERLRQALDNLVSNAVKYSTLGGVIRITLLKSSSFVRVEIDDAGPGFTAEDKEKMFQHFQRLSAKPTAGEHSTGIGLAIVKQIVELHNGKIWVENK
jgi:signal transduction histidine kinase